ncbi:hypothetical protein C8Q76DRAFT_218246 [Earliella scabrosa]|nr:hypothetical protein C8Q76DRAFT_218246 [Earliella scabrosa]
MPAVKPNNRFKMLHDKLFGDDPLNMALSHYQRSRDRRSGRSRASPWAGVHPSRASDLPTRTSTSRSLLSRQRRTLPLGPCLTDYGGHITMGSNPNMSLCNNLDAQSATPRLMLQPWPSICCNPLPLPWTVRLRSLTARVQYSNTRTASSRWARHGRVATVPSLSCVRQAGDMPLLVASRDASESGWRDVPGTTKTPGPHPVFHESRLLRLQHRTALLLDVCRRSDGTNLSQRTVSV